MLDSSKEGTMRESLNSEPQNPNSKYIKPPHHTQSKVDDRREFAQAKWLNRFTENQTYTSSGNESDDEHMLAPIIEDSQLERSSHQTSFHPRSDQTKDFEYLNQWKLMFDIDPVNFNSARSVKIHDFSSGN